VSFDGGPFRTEGETDWMGRHFFTGGVMPSRDLLPDLAAGFETLETWEWSGENYAKTAEAWLANLDANREVVLALFTRVYGAKEAARWLRRWRIFFMACAELFAYRDGTEWRVAHYLFEKAPRKVAAPAV